METNKKRTIQQNKSIHKYFELLADDLNSAGYDMKKMIKVDIPWSEYSTKNFIWRPIQEAMYGKKSTTQLTTKEIDKVYDVVNRFIAEKTGLHVPFPSIDYFREE